MAEFGDSFGYENLPTGYDFEERTLPTGPSAEEARLPDGSILGIQPGRTFRLYQQSGGYDSGTVQDINAEVLNLLGGSVNVTT